MNRVGEVCRHEEGGFFRSKPVPHCNENVSGGSVASSRQELTSITGNDEKLQFFTTVWMQISTGNVRLDCLVGWSNAWRCVSLLGLQCIPDTVQNKLCIMHAMNSQV